MAFRNSGNYEEQNPSDFSSVEIQGVLQEIFPGIALQEIYFLYHGTYNVYLIRDHFIFRFPDRHIPQHEAVLLLKREQALLQFLAPRLTIRIPDPIYFSLDPSHPFMGYEIIPGISLSRCFTQASPTQQNEMAQQIGRFLSELHSPQTLEEFQKWQKSNQNPSPIVAFSPQSYKMKWRKFFTRIQTEFYPLIRLEEQKWTSHIFHSFLENGPNFHFSPTLVHGDFDTPNILVDPDTFTVTGVIDFEEARIYDSAADFLFYDAGDHFLREIIANYNLSRDPHFEARMKFLYCRTYLCYLDYGVQHQIPGMIEEGMLMLHKNMKRFPLS